MKHIDAEKLKANIEKRIEETKYMKPTFDQFIAGQISAFKGCLSIITSLQQEQPKVDLVAELKHHLATTPKEQLEKEWKELEPWCNIGPTVQEFLYGKQPEVDLEKEIDAIWNPRFNLGWDEQSCLTMNRAGFEKFARHFYGLRVNAKE